MDSMFYMVLASIGMLALFVVFILIRRRKEVTETNYRSIFILGIILVLIGSVFYFSEITSTGLFIQFLGIIYIILGLANRDKWSKGSKNTTKEAQIY